MKRRLRILFPVIRIHSFVAQDLEALRSGHDVTVMRCVSPGEILRCILATRTHDCVFAWFGSLRFLLPILAARLQARRILVVAGGYDLADEPAIGYGNMRKAAGWGLSRWLGRLLFRAADMVITYSNLGSREAVANARVSPPRLRMIYLGFEALGEDPSPPPPKEAMVLTVAAIDSSTIYRKGLLEVAQTSRLMPDVQFVMAGRYEPDAQRMLIEAGGPNLHLVGFVSDQELSSLYARAKVYFQPSIHEAFGCAVAEAMAHRCLPVVSRRGSLPEVVGDTGFYVEPGNPKAMVDTLRAALGQASGTADQARQRIIDLFPAESRSRDLLELVDRVNA
jgi:glycosyltransferase involved in cell wall biosynthesis